MTLKPYFFKISLALAFFSPLAFGLGQRKPNLEAVRGFDLHRYLGTWYEIGSIPQIFQKSCVCTRAIYSFQGNSQVSVLNECRKNSPTGKKRSIKGVAEFRDSKSVGDFYVSFFLGIKGSYRIIALDTLNYEWSLVSNDKGTALWILSREPEMSEAQISLLLAEAKRLGIDSSRFKLSVQDSCW